MQAIRSSLLQRHVSGKAAEIIIDFWVATSLKQYQPYFQTWLKLCREWEIKGPFIIYDWGGLAKKGVGHEEFLTEKGGGAPKNISSEGVSSYLL
jgi:hypothetical protein